MRQTSSKQKINNLSDIEKNSYPFGPIAEETHAISRFLSLIFYFAHIAKLADITEFAWALEIIITNYFEFVMNDVIFENFSSEI